MYITKKRLATKLKTVICKRNIVILVVLLMLGLAALTLFNLKRLSVQEMKYALENLGGFSYIVFFALCCIRSLLFMPCGLFSTLGGLLFGPLMGTIITLLGFTAGSLVNFYLARLLGRDWTDKFTKGRIKNIDNVISRNGFSSIMIMRIVPVFPFDVVSCVAGLSRVRAGDFVAGTLLGSIPGVFLYNYLGVSVKALSMKKIAAAVIIIVVITLIPIIYKFVFKKNFFDKA